MHSKGKETKAADREVTMHPALATITIYHADGNVFPNPNIDLGGNCGRTLGGQSDRLKNAKVFEERDKVSHSIRKTTSNLIKQI